MSDYLLSSNWLVVQPKESCVVVQAPTGDDGWDELYIEAFTDESYIAIQEKATSASYRVFRVNMGRTAISKYTRYIYVVPINLTPWSGEVGSVDERFLVTFVMKLGFLSPFDGFIGCFAHFSLPMCSLQYLLPLPPSSFGVKQYRSSIVCDSSSPNFDSWQPTGSLPVFPRNSTNQRS